MRGICISKDSQHRDSNRAGARQLKGRNLKRIHMPDSDKTGPKYQRDNDFFCFQCQLIISQHLGPKSLYLLFHHSFRPDSATNIRRFFKHAQCLGLVPERLNSFHIFIIHQDRKIAVFSKPALEKLNICSGFC
jgi:hypothetical protein